MVSDNMDIIHVQPENTEPIFPFKKRYTERANENLRPINAISMDLKPRDLTLAVEDINAIKAVSFVIPSAVLPYRLISENMMAVLKLVRMLMIVHQENRILITFSILL